LFGAFDYAAFDYAAFDYAAFDYAQAPEHDAVVERSRNQYCPNDFYHLLTDLFHAACHSLNDLL
jgi:hypothetical protein